jgi:hypothetical protein
MESAMAESGATSMGSATNFDYDRLMEIEESEESKGAEGACGRQICAWCVPPRDLGPAIGFQPGELTHGICPTCRDKFFAPRATRSSAWPGAEAGS